MISAKNRSFKNRVRNLEGSLFCLFVGLLICFLFFAENRQLRDAESELLKTQQDLAYAQVAAQEAADLRAQLTVAGAELLSMRKKDLELATLRAQLDELKNEKKKEEEGEAREKKRGDQLEEIKRDLEGQLQEAQVCHEIYNLLVFYHERGSCNIANVLPHVFLG